MYEIAWYSFSYLDLLIKFPYEGYADFLKQLGNILFLFSVLLKNVYIIGAFLKCLLELTDKDIFLE